MIYYNGAWIKHDLGFYWWNNKPYYTLEHAKYAVDNAWSALQNSLRKI